MIQVDKLRTYKSKYRDRRARIKEGFLPGYRKYLRPRTRNQNKAYERGLADFLGMTVSELKRTYK